MIPMLKVIGQLFNTIRMAAIPILFLTLIALLIIAIVKKFKFEMGGKIFMISASSISFLLILFSIYFYYFRPGVRFSKVELDQTMISQFGSANIDYNDLSKNFANYTDNANSGNGGWVALNSEVKGVVACAKKTYKYDDEYIEVRVLQYKNGTEKSKTNESEIMEEMYSEIKKEYGKHSALVTSRALKYQNKSLGVQATPVMYGPNPVFGIPTNLDRAYISWIFIQKGQISISINVQSSSKNAPDLNNIMKDVFNRLCNYKMSK